MASNHLKRMIVLSAILCVSMAFPSLVEAQCPTMPGGGVDEVFSDPITTSRELTEGTYVFNLVNPNQGAIAAGAVVTVTGPGTVTIQVPPGGNFDVFGTLVVQPESSVVFEACGGSLWGALRIMPAQGELPSLIRNATFRKAGNLASLSDGGTGVLAFPRLDGRFPQHCVRLGRGSHTLIDSTFLEVVQGAVALMVNPSDQPVFDNLFLPGGTSPRTASVAFASFGNDKFLEIRDLDLQLSPTGSIQSFYFPMTTVFDAASSLVVLDDLNIFTGIAAVGTENASGAVNIDVLGTLVIDPPNEVVIDSFDDSTTIPNWGALRVISDIPATIRNVSFFRAGHPFSRAASEGGDAGTVNLLVNDTRFVGQGISSLNGQNVGGVLVSVTPQQGFIPGRLTLTGSFDGFSVGAESLWIDNVEAEFVPGSEFSNPPPFTADGLSSGLKIAIDGFVVFTGAEIFIRNLLNSMSQVIPDGFGEIGAEPVKENPADLEPVFDPGLRLNNAMAEFSYLDKTAKIDLDFFEIPVNTPALPESLPAHCLRLSSAPHQVDNLRFRVFGGVPILLEAPVVQNIGSIDLLPTADAPPQRFRAVAVAALDGATSTVVTGGTTRLAVNSDFDYYYFPLTTLFTSAATFVADPGVSIGMGPEASLSFLGDTDINGLPGQTVKVFPAIPGSRWGRVELVSSIAAVANSLELIRGGACIRLPQFQGSGSSREFVKLGTRFAPGAPLLLAGGRHSVSNLIVDDYIDMVIIQDIATEPRYTGVYSIRNATETSFRGIGVFDLAFGREHLPLVYPRNLTLSAPNVTYDPPDGPLPYKFDRDVVVPSRVNVTYRTGATLNQQLRVLFQKFEAIDNDPSEFSNLITNKCEMVVEGGFKSQGLTENRVLFSSSSHTTKRYIPPAQETDMGETDFKSLATFGKRSAKDLIVRLSGEDVEAEESGDAKAPKEAKTAAFIPPGSQDWAGIRFLDESDDLNSEILNSEIRNAIFGVTFTGSSGRIANSLIENSYGSAIHCRLRSSPKIEGNTLINNNLGGILLEFHSSPVILRNNISNNPTATGIHCIQFSSPVIAENQIIGNNVGVIAQSGSSPNMGRVPEGSANDPGFALDDGRNIISNNFNRLGIVVNVFNDTPNTIYAENNSWGTDNFVQIDATLLDDDEAGLLPFLSPNAGPVKYTPIFREATPTPNPSTLTTPTATATPLPQGSATPTKVVVPPIRVTPTPTPTVVPLPSQIISNTVLSGKVRITQDIVVKSGVTLEFRPGTRVLVEGPYGITVESNARILAVGERESRVFFMSEVDEYWKGVTIQGPDFGNAAARSILQHCVFQRAGIAGVSLSNVKAEITNCEFLGCYAGLHISGGVTTNPRVRRNVFRDNFISVSINLTGVVADLQPEQFFNLGLGRTNPNSNTNNDPGFNTFIQTGVVPGARDILVENFFAQSNLKADENLFLVPDTGSSYDLLPPDAIQPSGRVVSLVASATEVSLLPPPILKNITENDNGVVRIVDEEVWAGKVVTSATNYTELVEGIPLTILPGTHVGFERGPGFTARHPSLRFVGRVEAIGTKSRPIVFDSLSPSPTEFDWGGLRFASQELTRDVASLMRFIHVRHAKTGLTFHGGSKAVVTDSVVENCGDTAVVATSEFAGEDPVYLIKGLGGGPFPVSAPLLERVFVLGGPRAQVGLHSYFSSPVLRQCAIGVDPRDNRFQFRPFALAAIFVEGDKTPDLGTASDRGRNLFFGSANPEKGVYEIRQGSNQTVNAIGNYWYQNSTEGVKLNILDRDSNISTGPVNVSPFLPFPVALNASGGDLDRDVFYHANDFSAFMRGALGSTPFDDRYNPAADRNDDYVVDQTDLFLFALQNNTARVTPRRVFPATPTPTPSFTPLFFPTNTPTFTPSNTPTNVPAPSLTNTSAPPLTVVAPTPTFTRTPTATPVDGGPTATPTPTTAGPTATPTQAVPLIAIELCSGLPNPVGSDDGNEQITVRNLEASSQSLNGWYILNSSNARRDLSGLIAAEQSRTLTIASPAFLPNSGGETLRLFDPQNRLVDEDSYSGSPLEGEVVSFSEACPGSGGASLIRAFARTSTDFPASDGLLRLSTNPGSCGTVQQVDPQLGTRHAVILGGDVTSGSFRYRIWVNATSGTADFRVRVIHRQGSNGPEQILGTSTFSIGSSTPIAVENPINGTNPNAVAGDRLILEVTRISAGIQTGNYRYGNCANENGSEPSGHSWLQFTGSVANNN